MRLTLGAEPPKWLGPRTPSLQSPYLWTKLHARMWGATVYEISRLESTGNDLTRHVRGRPSACPADLFGHGIAPSPLGRGRGVRVRSPWARLGGPSPSPSPSGR